MKKKTLTVTAALILAGGLLIAMIIASICFFSGQILATSNEDEDLYYDHLYTISSDIINADRDFYQSMIAAVQYHDLQQAPPDVPPELLSELLGTYYQDYVDNRQQVMDRTDDAHKVASDNAKLFSGIKIDDKSFDDYYNEFIANFISWDTTYDVQSGEGDYSLFIQNFESTRKSLSDMTDIAEQWAIEEKAVREAGIKNRIIISAVAFFILMLVVFVIAFLIIRLMRKSLKYIVKSVGNMAEGDFATEIVPESIFNEFYTVQYSTEDMRSRLQESLRLVVASADTVNGKAQNTKQSITDSEDNTNNISVAVSELAEGAMTMAEDVQTTAQITVNMGDSIDKVNVAAGNNLEKVKALYEESISLQKQLVEIRKADEATDEKAGLVAESVGKTAEVVDEINTAAEGIINIASQTNLLALNASIEAARAGEAGKGFAVVADSIKGLAEESNQMAGQITNMLSTITQYSNENRNLTSSIKEATTNEATALEQMSDAFDKMLALLRETEEGNKEIASLVADMTDGKDQIMGSVDSLSSLSEEYAASTQETSASITQLTSNMSAVVGEADELGSIAEELKKNVEFFKVEKQED
jgi:methyl-accepting chemotaxis protein